MEHILFVSRGKLLSLGKPSVPYLKQSIEVSCPWDHVEPTLKNLFVLRPIVEENQGSLGGKEKGCSLKLHLDPNRRRTETVAQV